MEFSGGIPFIEFTQSGQINYTSGNYIATFSVTNSCGTTTQQANFSVNTILSPIITPQSVEICSGANFTVTLQLEVKIMCHQVYTWSTLWFLRRAL
jgi:hypothetical protein